MDYLKLDVKRVRDNVAKTGDQLNKYATKTNDYFDELEHVDKFWIDASSSVFVKTVADDQEYFKELVEATKKQINNISNFCDELESRITPYFNASSLRSIKYINSTTNHSLETLNQIATKINELKADIASVSVPAQSSCRSAIMSLANGLDTRVVSETANTIREAVRTLNQVVSTAKNKALSEKKYDMDDRTIKYNGQISEVNLMGHSEVEEKDYANSYDVQKFKLNEINHNLQQTEVGYSNKAVDTELFDIEATPDVKDVSYQNKTNSSLLNGIEAEKTKDGFEYKNQVKNIELNSINDDENQEYDYKNKASALGLTDQAIHGDETDYELASKDTTKIIFEGGDAHDVVKTDYDYKEQQSDLNLKHEATDVADEYDYKNDAQNFSLRSGDIKAGTDYEYRERLENVNLNSDAHVVKSADYSNDGSTRVFDLDSEIIDNGTKYDDISSFDDIIR